MISHKSRDGRRARTMKMSKNIERLYKETKCRELSILVKKMDFAKILGKFTKVKIRYEASSTPKTKKATEVSPNSRLKSNENGMVNLPRKSYNQHPANEVLNLKVKDKSMPSPRQVSNILKENNRLKKPLATSKIQPHDYHKKLYNNNLKHYGIIFESPNSNINNDNKNKISLPELVPLIDNSILPSDEWCINYFPKNEEPKDDKVYDRIAAELEDLMYNEKPVIKSEDKTANVDNKVDEFPSIMDILNDNSNEDMQKTNNDSTIEFKPSLESSDVEAMLLGKSNTPSENSEATPMELDNKKIEVVQLNHVQDVEKNDTKVQETDDIDNPQSPSILSEDIAKDSEEKNLDHALNSTVKEEKENETKDANECKLENETKIKDDTANKKIDKSKEKNQNKFISPADIDNITHVVFTKTVDGKSSKSVLCPKNLKYSIELEGKSVEFLGAPSFISSLEDLQVLLQIVNETDLERLYVMH